MKRGNIVLVQEPNTPASKARPYVLVSRDTALVNPRKVTGCPLTSRLGGVTGRRPLVTPAPGNGLRSPSEIEVDWIYTHPIERIGGVIGSVDPATMRTIDTAIRKWFAL